MSFIKLAEPDKKMGLSQELRAEYAEELASIMQFLQDRKAFESIDFLNKNLKEIPKHELSELNLQFLKQISKFFSDKIKKGNSNKSFPRSRFELQKRHGPIFFIQRCFDLKNQETWKWTRSAFEKRGTHACFLSRKETLKFLMRETTATKKQNANARPRIRWTGATSVWWVHVPNHMGRFISSENSLNQHIKLKHSDLWEKLKTVENEPGKKFIVEMPIGNGEEIRNKDNEIVFW